MAQSPNCGATVPALRNGGFELPANAANRVTNTATPNAQLVWLNTAENTVEIWHQAFQGISAHEGSQFVEPNTSRAGTL
jgi:hypothetical protein